MSGNAVIYLLVLYFLKFHCVKSSEPVKGPYISIPVAVRNCTEKEVVHPHSSFGQFVQWHGETYNSSGKTFIRFDYTVLKPMETLKAKVRSYFWEDNQWKLRLVLQDFSCVKFYFRYVLEAFKLNTNRQCSIAKVSRTIERFDYNAIHQAWELDTEYGRWIWLYELISRGRTLFCSVVESVAVPKRKPKVSKKN